MDQRDVRDGRQPGEGRFKLGPRGQGSEPRRHMTKDQLLRILAELEWYWHRKYKKQELDWLANMDARDAEITKLRGDLQDALLRVAALVRRGPKLPRRPKRKKKKR